MYSWEMLVLLRHLLDQFVGKTAIAAQTGVSRGLIYHLLPTRQLDRDLAAPRPARARPRVPHELDDYCAIIDARLATYPALSAVRLMVECRAAGYTGGYSQLCAYVAHFGPSRSLVSLEVDHPFRSKPITRFGASRSPVSADGDHAVT